MLHDLHVLYRRLRVGLNKTLMQNLHRCPFCKLEEDRLGGSPRASRARTEPQSLPGVCLQQKNAAAFPRNLLGKFHFSALPAVRPHCSLQQARFSGFIFINKSCSQCYWTFLSPRHCVDLPQRHASASSESSAESCRLCKTE